MNFMELIKTGLSFVKDKAFGLFGLIAKANIMSVAKFAVGVGVAVGTGVMVLKFFRDKFNMIRQRSFSQKKSPADNALNKNFFDQRRSRELHPKMRKVTKTLWNKDTRHGEQKYGFLRKVIHDYEKDHGKMDAYDYRNPASREWWEDRFSPQMRDNLDPCPFVIDLSKGPENVTYKYIDTPDEPPMTDDEVLNFVRDFNDYMDNYEVDGYKSPEYFKDDWCRIWHNAPIRIPKRMKRVFYPRAYEYEKLFS